MDRIGQTPCVVIIGKRETGKATLAREIIRRVKEVKPVEVAAFCWNPTKYEGVQTFENYDAAVCENIITMQREAVRGERDGGPPATHKLLVFDQCFMNVKDMWSLPMQTLYSNRQSLRIGLIVIMQFPIKMPPLFRCNVDMTFAFRDNNKKLLYENYFSGFPEQEDFVRMFDEVTSQPFTCLVVDYLTANYTGYRVEMGA